ncbi:MAG: tRNA epoxyqueuosine(34) reductase QueG [Verrucomicrobiaceae bacterium]|nr:tRNA epoxyqueuosine(34) reductase QueG [Verrucomicrobiaceae bacterium]
MMPGTLESRVREIASGLGFDDCRFTPARRATHADDFQSWIDSEKYGDMEWMQKSPERRKDPRLLVEGAKTVIVLALNYFPGGGPEARSPGNGMRAGRFARYAMGSDYHLVIDKKLKAFSRELETLGGAQRFYVDYGPVLERDFATDAGLGWNGKSTMQIHPRLGTWFFLAELVTTLDLQPDAPMPDRCGKCTACVDCCPTAAITSPRHLDARRCISYLTIEHRGPIPEEFREVIGDRIFGCDDCLEVCPWNRFAKASKESKFAARDYISWPLRDFLTISGEDFRVLFRQSPVKRIGHERFLRNICVALGNVGDEADLTALRDAAQGGNPLVAEHACWAIERIVKKSVTSCN